MKKSNVFFLVLLAIGLVFVGCGDDNNTNNNNNGGSAGTGLYVGIIGFNDSITKKQIGLLNSGSYTGTYGIAYKTSAGRP